MELSSDLIFVIVGKGKFWILSGWEDSGVMVERPYKGKQRPSPLIGIQERGETAGLVSLSVTGNEGEMAHRVSRGENPVTSQQSRDSYSLAPVSPFSPNW